MKYFVKLITAILFISIAVTSSSWAADLCSDTIRTAEGPVKGLAALNGKVCTYKGIPYAAPPQGELRWKAPQPAAKHTAVFEALDFGPSCAQKETIEAGGKSKVGFSEDCLTLNIFRPAKAGTFPVMYWIYGGGFTQGGSSYEIYNGERLAAERDVVVVSINYRLGPFGFMALPELAKEDPNGSSGNYGILDQIQGLKWVRDNINNFGGDPKNVTIFGESAGGVSVCTLLASGPAAGLFHKAVIQSGGCDLAQPVEKGYEQARKYAKAVGCEGDDIRACMRAKSPKELLEKTSGLLLMTNIDGYVLQKKPSDLLKEGKFNRVPVMVGSNKDEGNIMIVIKPGALHASRKTITKQLKKLLPKRADEILKMYSYDDYRRPIFLIGAIFADGFGARAFDAADKISAFAPVYYYRFDWDHEVHGKSLGAFHGLDVPFVFGNLKLSPWIAKRIMNKKVRKEATPLSEAMMTCWSNFAKTGDPNGQGIPAWPKYSSAKRERLYFNTQITVAPLTDTQLARYRYWAAITFEELADMMK